MAPAMDMASTTTSPHSCKRVTLEDDFDERNLRKPTPLTVKNLQLHTRLESPQTVHSMAVGSSASAASCAVYDSQTELQAYGVVLDSSAPLPVPLQHYVDISVKAPQAPESPSAKHLHHFQPFAQATGAKSKSLALIAPYLMFPDCTDLGDDRAEKDVYFAYECQFERPYVRHSNGSCLTQPRPDKTNSYMPQRIAGGRISAPFDDDEEAILNEDSIHRDALCPFLTAEFKNAMDGLLVATLQGARDGVAVQNYLQALFDRADMTPTVVDTCHWSLTCNTQSAQLSLHWWGQDGRYHMHEFCNGNLRAPCCELDRNGNMVRLRKFLRNILGYAMNERLRRIKEVIAAIQSKRKNGAERRRKGFSPNDDLADELAGR